MQAIHIGRTYITTGSVDGHVRTYDLRMGELRTDFLGRTSLPLLVSLQPSYYRACRPSDSSRALAGQPDVPRDDNRRTCAPDGHVHGEDAERLHGPRELVVPNTRMLWTRRGERRLWGRGRESVGMGFGRCAYSPATTFLEYSHCLPFIPLALRVPHSTPPCFSGIQAAPLQPNPPPVVHDKVITWAEHHPIEAGEMITASADGTVKVWRS